MLARLFVFLQYLLPKYLLTSIVYRVTRIRSRAVKNGLIGGFLRIYDVNIDEVDMQVPDDFATFNDFFTRELAADARPVDAAPETLVSPVDGTLSQAGAIREDRLLQAKGIDYTLDDLLAIDLEQAQAFRNGSFATIYWRPTTTTGCMRPWTANSSQPTMCPVTCSASIMRRPVSCRACFAGMKDSTCISAHPTVL